jgi:hypothetical protein
MADLSRRAGLLMVGLALAGPTSAQTVINQVRALGGGVTPGDTPGFPVTISRPGSYKLTSNLFIGNPVANAIEIVADNVTLNLNGFMVQGPTVCTGTPLVCTPCCAGDGVVASARTNVSVLNGTVVGMGGTGITMGAESIVENMRTLGNGGNGISVGLNSAVRRSVASRNGVHGMTINAGSLVHGNVATFNNQIGIFVDCPSNLIANSTVGNGVANLFPSPGDVSCRDEHNWIP